MEKEKRFSAARRGAALLLMFLLLLLPAGRVWGRNYALKKYNKNRWTLIQKDYLKKDIDRLIFVKYTGGSKANIEMWKKVKVTAEVTASKAGAAEEEEPMPFIEEEGATEASPESTAAAGKETSAVAPTTAAPTTTAPPETTAAVKKITYKWKKILSCSGYVGLNGIKKVKEGDKKTPTGAFRITMAFGIKKSPGTAGISYTKLNKYYYWSGEEETYNTFVDVRDLGRTWMAGEHLISYVPFYNYALAMDFNKEGVYKKGSAIFMHCTKPGRYYTAGCVAIAESKMKKVVKNTTRKTMIFIYPAGQP